MADRIKDSSSFNGNDSDLPLKYFDMHELRASSSFKVLKPNFTSASFPLISALSINIKQI